MFSSGEQTILISVKVKEVGKKHLPETIEVSVFTKNGRKTAKNVEKTKV